jgi:hypothetical protein
VVSNKKRIKRRKLNQITKSEIKSCDWWKLKIKRGKLNQITILSSCSWLILLWTHDKIGPIWTNFFHLRLDHSTICYHGSSTPNLIHQFHLPPYISLFLSLTVTLKHKPNKFHFSLTHQSFQNSYLFQMVKDYASVK